MKTIYVGNMNYSMTDVQLKEIFSVYGVVNSTKIIVDKNSKRPKGYGFIEMENDEEALNAINQLNGKECMGRNLKVSDAFRKDKEA